jgi:hypothetical protein
MSILEHGNAIAVFQSHQYILIFNGLGQLYRHCQTVAGAEAPCQQIIE